MTGQTPPLLIIRSYPDKFNLLAFLKTEDVQPHISLNTEKYNGLNRFEVVFDGMAFELELFNQMETQELLKDNRSPTLFGSPPPQDVESIGIFLGDNLLNGKHLPSVNRALLACAKIIGHNCAASHIGWLPSAQSIDFGHFIDSVDDYLAGGPTPILFQIAIHKNGENVFETQGLNYFSGQEISLESAQELADSETIKRLVRIAHDIAVNGKIDTKLETDGLVAGETLVFTPSAGNTIVDIKIKMSSDRLTDNPAGYIRSSSS